MSSVLIFTVHKAASMFLHRLAKGVTNELGMRHYSVNDKKYFDEIKQLTWKAFIENKVKQDSNPSCFGPIREGATAQNIPNKLSEHSIILHLRDPRDVLTSLFFPSVAQTVSPQVKALQAWIQQQPQVHVDESPWLVGSVKEWMWVVSGEGYGLQ